MVDLKVALTVLPVLAFCSCIFANEDAIEVANEGAIEVANEDAKEGAPEGAQDSRQHQLASLYHFSGIHAHLSQVHDTVMQESTQSLTTCADDASLPAIENLIADSTNAHALQADYIQTLGELLSDEQVDEIIEWTRGPIGLKVHQLEADSASLDEAKFEALISEYRASGKHTSDRAASIKTMIANTGAVYFISALNTESSAIVIMASLCQLDSESLSAAQNAVRSARGEEGLIRAFLRPDLLMPASVIYRTMSTEELNQFIAFTESDSGKAYYKALIQSTRIVLSKRVDSLEQQLEATMASD